MSKNISTEVLNLISMKQEGAYWDFKRQWYEDGHESDMLHDIICMANNLSGRDAFIIIGVDEDKDFAMMDVSTDSKRRNTQKLVDFLRDKKFAGDIRPIVYVETIENDNSVLDIIVIQNTTKTPYYLREKYQKVNANNIYTRVQDTNTPTNKSADIWHVEYLWKKRFGLIQSPLEKMKIFLSRKEEWECSPGVENVKYYKYAPEFTISYPFEDPEGRNGKEYYLLSQMDQRPHWTMIQLKYHQTLLDEVSGIILDGGRHFSNSPQRDGISLTGHYSWDISYSYWVEDTLGFIIHKFYLDEESHEAQWSEHRFMENILIFESEHEHQMFNYYVKRNWCNKDKYANNLRLPYIENEEEQAKEILTIEYTNVQILQKMLIEFRMQ